MVPAHNFLKTMIYNFYISVCLWIKQDTVLFLQHTMVKHADGINTANHFHYRH